MRWLVHWESCSASIPNIFCNADSLAAPPKILFVPFQGTGSYKVRLPDLV